MELLFKTAMCAAAAGILALIIKKTNPEMAAILGLAAAGAIIYAAGTQLGEIIDFFTGIFHETGLNEGILGVVLKTTAVTVITRISSDLCRDAGHSASSSAIEFFGAVTVLCMGMPLFETLMQMINSMT